LLPLSGFDGRALRVEERAGRWALCLYPGAPEEEGIASFKSFDDAKAALAAAGAALAQGGGARAPGRPWRLAGAGLAGAAAAFALLAAVAIAGGDRAPEAGADGSGEAPPASSGAPMDAERFLKQR